MAAHIAWSLHYARTIGITRKIGIVCRHPWQIHNQVNYALAACVCKPVVSGQVKEKVCFALPRIKITHTHHISAFSVYYQPHDFYSSLHLAIFFQFYCNLVTTGVSSCVYPRLRSTNCVFLRFFLFRGLSSFRVPWCFFLCCCHRRCCCRRCCCYCCLALVFLGDILLLLFNDWLQPVFHLVGYKGSGRGQAHTRIKY